MTFDRFLCPICSKKTDTLGKLNKHEKTHTKPFICETCKKGFALRVDLSRHIKSRHRTGNEQYRCHVEGCSFTSNRKDNLKRHQRNKHSSTLLSSHVRMSNDTQASLQQSEVLNTTPLCSASNFMQVATLGDLNQLRVFLDAGLTVDTKADDGSTVLHCAARAGQVEMVNYLLDVGARVDARNGSGRLPLHEAILSNSTETFESLLGFMTQEELRSPGLQLKRYLSQACHIGIIHAYLARLGFDFTNQSAPEKLKFAIHTGHDTLVANLLDDPRIDCNYRQGNSYGSIHLAAIVGREKVMQVFLASSRVDKTLKTSRGRQALHLAAIKGHAAIVEQLIHHPSVDVNCRDNYEATALHYASSNGHANVVEQLVRHRSVNVSCKNKEGATPLHCASSKGRTMVVEQLISLPSVDVNCQNRNASTPLHHASKSGHTMVVAQLIRHPNIDINCQCMDAATPLHYAASNGHWETASFLLKHSESMKYGRCISSDVAQTSLSFSKEVEIHRLLKHPDFGCPNKRLPGGKTVLHVAVFKGDCEAIRVLLAYQGIDVNMCFGSGMSLSPLMIAAQRGKLEAVKLLLQHKHIDINKKGGWMGNTALRYASHYSNNEIVDLLLSHDAIDNDAKAPTTVPTPTRPDDSTHFDYLDDDMDGAPTEAWEEFRDMDEGMEV